LTVVLLCPIAASEDSRYASNFFTVNDPYLMPIFAG
jgi:hypothetical protein